MPFTDDDLKRLKEDLDDAVYDMKEPITYPQLYALLARLEAAENLIGALITGSGHKVLRAAEDQWHEAAGK